MDNSRPPQIVLTKDQEDRLRGFKHSPVPKPSFSDRKLDEHLAWIKHAKGMEEVYGALEILVTMVRDARRMAESLMDAHNINYLAQARLIELMDRVEELEREADDAG